MKETLTPENNCPYCGKKFDRCSSMEDDATAKPGDFTLCITCSCLMAFDESMRVRPLTQEEVEILMGDRRLQEIVRRTAVAIRTLNAIMPKN